MIKVNRYNSKSKGTKLIDILHNGASYLQIECDEHLTEVFNKIIVECYNLGKADMKESLSKPGTN